MSYVRFYSDSSFSIGFYQNSPHFMGVVGKTMKLEISTDGSTWATWTGTSAVSSTTAISGKYNIYLRGTNIGNYSSGTYMGYPVFVFNGTDLIDSEGEIESLLDYTTVDNGDHVLPPNIGTGGYQFTSLFRNCTLLRSAPTLGLIIGTPDYYYQNCYLGMFYGCTSLIVAPELPSTNSAAYCYYQMFYGCTSLTTPPSILPFRYLRQSSCTQMFFNCTALTSAPELPATTLYNSCYEQMFYYCESLTVAPELPATTLYNSCYSMMFYGCTSLTTTPILLATTLAGSCYSFMFAYCTALTTISKLPAVKLANSCYNSMFTGTNLTLTTTSDSTHTAEFRVPTIGNISTTATNWNSSMFPTSSAVRAPDLNTTYYINATLLDATTDYMVTKSELSSIATAIREKTENYIPLTYPDDFISELDNIQPGELTSFLSGSSLPASSTGVNGDFYTYTGS